MRHSMACPRMRTSSCAERKLLSRGDANLQVHQVQSRDQFRHRMLDLQPRIHFQEIEILRARSTRNSTVPALCVAGSLGHSHRDFAHAPAHFRHRPAARALPPSPSGGGAGWSTRARRDRPCCRARPPAPASRCAGGSRWLSRDRLRRLRKPAAPRSVPLPARLAALAAACTRRMPLPPPPAAAFSMTG